MTSTTADLFEMEIPDLVTLNWQTHAAYAVAVASGVDPWQSDMQALAELGQHTSAALADRGYPYCEACGLALPFHARDCGWLPADRDYSISHSHGSDMIGYRIVRTLTPAGRPQQVTVLTIEGGNQYASAIAAFHHLRDTARSTPGDASWFVADSVYPDGCRMDAEAF